LDEHFGQRRTADCVRDGVSVLKLGVTATAISKKSLVDHVPFGYGTPIKQPSEGLHID
jgi:hypothetical protein